MCALWDRHACHVGLLLCIVTLVFEKSISSVTVYRRWSSTDDMKELMATLVVVNEVVTLGCTLSSFVNKPKLFMHSISAGRKCATLCCCFGLCHRVISCLIMVTLHCCVCVMWLSLFSVTPAARSREVVQLRIMLVSCNHQASRVNNVGEAIRR